MLDKHGQEHSDRQKIADIFATFYEELYSSRTTCQPCFVNEDGDNIPPFTVEELKSELKKLKDKKCRDTSGLVAEMLKCGGETLASILCETYNQLLTCSCETPTSWKETIFTVLHKSGDERQPSNYRPIVIIPILYKLFARLLYSRLAPILDAEQCPDQAGFRPNYATVDHLFTFSQLREKTDEFQLNLWLAAIDFKKAFDAIDQDGLWHALRQQKVPPSYIRILKQLYAGQSGRVRTDKLSKPFDIERGTKQGDPLSSLLFNSLLEHIMRQLKPKWHSRQCGIQVGTGEATRLTNLRFADDVLIVGRTRHQITTMLGDLHATASQFGLQLHPDKTKVITNATKKTGRGKCDKIRFADMDVDILPLDGSVKYLGRKLSFENSQEVELKNRIRAGWAKFMANKQELVGKHYTLNSRLKLFDAVVSPTVLYAAGSWTLTKQQEHALNCTQRRMLRMILGAGRQRQVSTTQDQDMLDESSCDELEDDTDALQAAEPTGEEHKENLEPWVEWIQRVTHKIEELAAKSQVHSWVSRARLAKWRLAARIANQCPDRWSLRVLRWSPDRSFDGNICRAHRKRSRPKLRWFDDIQRFLELRLLPIPWQSFAHDIDAWEECAEEFCSDDWRQISAAPATAPATQI